MATAVTTGDFAKALEPLSGKWFGDGYNSNEALYKQVFTERKSDRAYEEDALISGLGLHQSTPEGEATTYDHARQGFVKRYNHTDYRSGIIVTQNMIDDGMSMSIMERRARMLGRSAMETKNTVAFNVLNRAYNSSYVGGDGVELSSAAHPTRAGNQRNELSTATDLSEAALEQMVIDMASITDDRGLKIRLSPRKLVIPTELMFDSHRILKSLGRVSTADNDINAVKDMGMFPEGIVVSPYLTDADSFFILTSENENGLVFLSRKEPELSADKDFQTDNAQFKSHMRFDCGWTDWRHVFSNKGGAA